MMRSAPSGFILSTAIETSDLVISMANVARSKSKDFE
jgi:hypothetical protein